MHMRWMIRSDMPRVMWIEHGSFNDPWTEEEFLNCLRQQDCIGMVLERSDRVVGFVIYRLKQTVLHIENIAVDPQHRRTGVGRYMISRLVSKLTFQKRRKIVLEVGEANLDAQLFFRSVGFRAVSVLRDYFESGEDAYVFQLAKDAGVTSNA